MYKDKRKNMYISGLIALLIILIVALGIYAIYRTYNSDNNKEVIDQTEQTIESESIVPNTLDNTGDENPLV